MTDMEKLGDIPGPYGKKVEVFHEKGNTDPEAFFHDLDGCMDIAGIHDTAKRDACRATLLDDIKGKGGVSFELLMRYGGRTVPKVRVSKPAAPATLALPYDPKIREVSENWTTLVMDQPDWTARSEALLDVLKHSMKEARSWTQTAFMGDFVHAFALSVLVTSAIEHLAEKEIDCLEQAAFYALSFHPEWQAAGAEWLHPFRKTWFRDWASARPTWQDFATGMRAVGRDLPSWIVKGGRA